MQSKKFKDGTFAAIYNWRFWEILDWDSIEDFF